jgi:hypothetical protein
VAGFSLTAARFYFDFPVQHWSYHTTEQAWEYVATTNWRVLSNTKYDLRLLACCFSS